VTRYLPSGGLGRNRCTRREPNDPNHITPCVGARRANGGDFRPGDNDVVEARMQYRDPGGSPEIVASCAMVDWLRRPPLTVVGSDACIGTGFGVTCGCGLLQNLRQLLGLHSQPQRRTGRSRYKNDTYDQAMRTALCSLPKSHSSFTRDENIPSAISRRRPNIEILIADLRPTRTRENTWGENGGRLSASTAPDPGGINGRGRSMNLIFRFGAACHQS
jgi:hypothetical protein